MTLYLKYRPQTIDELDLESVRDSLTKILQSQNIPHAYLFSGPKGTGKTSAARILAKIINCENKEKPCNTCSQCLSIIKGNNMDVIELDAASNRGIDDIRSLKENIMLAPIAASKKIYIIDEAHMLTTEASNAFLKTLEEPPAHVMFILATTNPEKLPETVISRLTRINFTKATNKDIARQIARVVKGEKLKITDRGVEKIAKSADGSFRDAVKILESLSFGKKEISESDVQNLLHSDTNNVATLFETLKSKTTKEVFELIEKNVQDGIAIKFFTTQILEAIHQSLLAKNGIGDDNLSGFTADELINLAKLLQTTISEIYFSPIPELPLEIALMKFALESKPSEKKEIQKNSSMTSKTIDEASWQKILQTMRTRNAIIEGLLRAAQPLGINDKILTIGVFYRFHKEKLEQPTTKKILEEVICELIQDKDMHVDFLLTEKKPAKVDKQSLSTTVDNDIINAAKEIFGS